MIDEFNVRKKELDDKYDREQIEEPKTWVPGTKAEKVQADQIEYIVDDIAAAEHTTALVSELDTFEQTYLTEYEKVYVKDKADGKDLNYLAL